MITGVETAGLTLAALPLVISALEHYNDGLKPLRDFMRYKELIKEMVGDLKTQRLLLRNTCEQLLIGVVESDVELTELLDDPTSNSWVQEALVSALRKRLQHSFDTFVDLVSRLRAALDGLTSRMGLDVYGQPRWVDAKSRKQYWKRFSNCLAHKEHEALLSRMAKDNQNLKHLVQDSLQLEPVRSRRQKRKYKLHGIRNHASRLHCALQSLWSCKCSDPHYAHLQLEQRDWDLAPCFRLTFPMAETHAPTPPWIWYRTEIKVCEKAEQDLTSKSSLTHVTLDKTRSSMSQNNLSDSFQRFRQSEQKKVAFALIPGLQIASVHTEAQPEEPRVIENLCVSLRSTYECSAITCIGQLTKEECNYNVYSIARENYQDGAAATLTDVLTQNQGLSPDSSNRLTRKIRLQLAAILASTALQLQTTPWLDNNWNGNSIKFHQGAFSHPYISKVFTTTQTRPVSVSSMGPVRNQALFSLGVLLLELSTGRPLDSFKVAQDLGHPFEDFVTATRLLQMVSDEESTNYYQAAQACIFCNFRGSAKDLDLANDAFRQAFYEDVVEPLEEDYKYYCRA